MPNESAKIILAATHGKLTKVRDCLLIEDSINSIQCQFEFRTSDWDNTTKTAVFFRGWATPSTPDADTVYVILDESNTCYIPSEILNKNTLFSVGVFGTSDDYRIVSNWMYYKIKDGCFAEGNEPLNPGSILYEQIVSMLMNKSNIDHKHDEIYYTKSEVDNKISTISIQAGQTYVHTQSQAADTWTIKHNLNKYPSVSVVDSANSIVVGEITYINKNELIVGFTGAFSGKAILN